MSLTDTAIRNAKPSVTPAGKETGKPYKMGDAGGLYLEVAPSGGKWWRLKYRYDDDLGLMGKLTHKITTWLRKHAD